MNNLGDAITLAANIHNNQLDKAGEPYILHCIQVMNDVRSKDSEIRQIAVLHDSIEDCEDVDEVFLKGFGFSDRVVSGISLLTKRKGQTYQEYLDGIVTNRDAILVKMADIRHNSDIRRLKGLTQKDFQRVQKYQEAYSFLKKALKDFPKEV